MLSNIDYGGTARGDFDRVVEVIRSADADVVAIQEACGNIPRLARALGWDHYDTRLHRVSMW